MLTIFKEDAKPEEKKFDSYGDLTCIVIEFHYQKYEKTLMKKQELRYLPVSVYHTIDFEEKLEMQL